MLPRCGVLLIFVASCVGSSWGAPECTASLDPFYSAEYRLVYANYLLSCDSNGESCSYTTGLETGIIYVDSTNMSQRYDMTQQLYDPAMNQSATIWSFWKDDYSATLCTQFENSICYCMDTALPWSSLVPPQATYIGQVTIGSAPCGIWTNQTNTLSSEYITTLDCIPVSILSTNNPPYEQGTSQMSFVNYHKETDTSIFNLPPRCIHTTEKK
ncbi:hypothetical protein Pelo_2437 [Pelomyxa schiedti]|nr:hypothetical protein Pelo_2437 [Pelomyxa schiedti]